MTDAPAPAITAFVQTQAWINDYAVDVDGATDFGVTAQILNLAATHGWDWVKANVTDNSDISDNLWYDSRDREAHGHTGPFYVNVQDAIEDYLAAFQAAHGRPATTEDARDALAETTPLSAVTN